MCLDLGIDPNVADDEGRTALHGAAHKGRLEVIQLLVDHGANLTAHDGGSRDSVNGALLGKTWIPHRLGARPGPRRRAVGDSASGRRGVAGQADDRAQYSDPAATVVIHLFDEGV